MAPARWIEPDEALPAPVGDIDEPGGEEADLRGLVAVGRDLGPARLLEAYGKGLFPWFSHGQPVLWWSPDPRMVLYLDEFRLHRSLRKVMKRQLGQGHWQVTLDAAFERVMRACAQPRDGQPGTWITREMIEAYGALHRAGYAHSVEVWFGPPAHDELIGGLYGVAMGRMFFGESMFARRADASKTALAALVPTLQAAGFRMLDCQQKTGHLASFGAREIPRAQFLAQMHSLAQAPAPAWQELQIGFPAA
ncbi:MAG: leucyl/phenylalanyl-tRNA--protein transferase [Burkholderiaceae bacterium]